MRIALTLTAILALCPPAATAAGDPEPVEVRLLADAASLEPGASFVAGVLFDLEPGWHVYWRNPGEAGLSTAVEIRAPAGLEVGPLRWPLPVAFDQAEGIPGYGYEGGVLLTREVRVPASWRADGSPASLSAEVSWLACRKVCVAGSASLALELPQRASAAEAAAKRVASWEDRLPTADAPPLRMTPGAGLAPGERAGEVTAWLDWGGPAPEVEWFPAPGEGLKVSGAGARSRANLTRLDARVAVVGRNRTPAELPSLLVVVDETGGRTGYPLAVPILDAAQR
jgi:DsbC/DsbD-like thiol-disulfide interchange protein